MLKSILIFIFLDLFFFKFSGDHFNNQVKVIQGTEINFRYIPAILAYLFMGIGFKKFIIDSNETSEKAFLLGIIIYGTYESTNMAIFDKWNIKSFTIDTLWGGILFYLTSKLHKKINL